MSYEPKIEVGNDWYFPQPYSSFRLSRHHDRRLGMAVIGSIGLVSSLATLGLSSFIVYRFVRYRWRCQTFEGYNQYVVLVLNLLLADCQQAMAFVVNFHWLAIDRLLAPSAACSAQGWLLNSGDVAGGLFVLLIALHTLITAAYGKRISLRVFTAAICVAWFLAYFMTSVAWLAHGDKFFVRAATWCWISPRFAKERLLVHYFWLFLAQFGTFVVYIITFIKLRRTTGELSQVHSGDNRTSGTIAAVRRISTLMMLYPAVYALTTLPISIGRMWSMAHDERTIEGPFMTVAASLFTSCGWIDCILYTLTRGRLLKAMVSTRDPLPHNNLEFADIGSTLTREESKYAESKVSDISILEKERETRHTTLPQKEDPSIQIRTDPREYRRKLAPIREFPDRMDPPSWAWDGADVARDDPFKKYRRRPCDISIDLNALGVIPPVYSPTIAGSRSGSMAESSNSVLESPTPVKDASTPKEDFAPDSIGTFRRSSTPGELNMEASVPETPSTSIEQERNENQDSRKINEQR